MKRVLLVSLFCLLCLPLMAQTQTQGLPPGMTLTADGHLQGQPTASGIYNFNVWVHDSEATPQYSNQVNVTIVVYGKIILQISVQPPGGIVNMPYPDTAPFKVDGGQPPYTYELVKPTPGAVTPGL